MTRTTQSTIALFVMTACWGVTFPLIHAAVHDISPALFVILRFALASVILLPLALPVIKHTNRSLLIDALILGLLNGGSYLFQTIGLETISSSNSAFITSLCVIVVPFLMPLLRIGTPRWLDIVAAVLTVCGVFILTKAEPAGLSIGDLWTLGSAIVYACYIVYLQIATQKNHNVKLLVFYQIIITMIFPIFMLPIEPLVLHLTSAVWTALLFCGIVATAFALMLQNTYQKHISAAKAAIIYASEPIFASLFAGLIAGEILTRYTYIGGGFIILGFLVSQALSQIKVRTS